MSRAKKKTKTVRVAVYTRQSVADDLEFGSLAAQREACESYIKSQPGWTLVPTSYDDSGASGGTTDRPALRQLLTDIEAELVDMVGVYKLDRLSRSITDFVKLMDVFEQYDVGFVSVTQAFDTSTSLGRMTVNLLATFATYERDMVRERTRDKMAATRRRGQFCGGRPPLGYDAREKKLVVNEVEAERVRAIFDLFLSLRSVLAVVDEVNRRGWKTKTIQTKTGRVLEGGSFGKGSARRILCNPVYVGRVRYAGEIFEGQHEAIVDEDTWRLVQERLGSSDGTRRSRSVGKRTTLLGGLVRCRCGATMTTHYTASGSRRYRYFVCSTQQKHGASACPGSRVSVGELEAFVVERIRHIGSDAKVITATAAAARERVKTQRPLLEKRLRTERATLKRLQGEKRNLVDALATGSAGGPTLHERLAQAEVEFQQVSKRMEAIAAELTALDLEAVDERDLKRALASFTPIWDELFPQEKARILQLLIERVVYDGEKGEVEISFRPGGVRMLAEDEQKESA